ncbi:MAG: hypothetical protein LC778_19805 [Acidobacteria bacterium]|nr:hypothetical protein [Acidobacteriota bacterium]
MPAMTSMMMTRSSDMIKLHCSKCKNVIGDEATAYFTALHTIHGPITVQTGQITVIHLCSDCEPKTTAAEIRAIHQGELEKSASTLHQVVQA